MNEFVEQLIFEESESAWQRLEELSLRQIEVEFALLQEELVRVGDGKPRSQMGIINEIRHALREPVLTKSDFRQCLEARRREKVVEARP